MPLKRLKNGRFRAISYTTGKPLGPPGGVEGEGRGSIQYILEEVPA